MTVLGELLSCYKPHCRYLTTVSTTDDRADGTFEIPSSCYIDDTGHLNAAEVTICYNQLLYALAAAAPVFDSSAEFRRRRLTDILIASYTCEFRRPIDPRSFRGSITFDRVRRLPKLMSIDTTFGFGDDHGGEARGTARVAIVSGHD